MSGTAHGNEAEPKCRQVADEEMDSSYEDPSLALISRSKAFASEAACSAVWSLRVYIFDAPSGS